MNVSETHPAATTKTGSGEFGGKPVPNGNGRHLWEVLWKVLSLIAIPWAIWVSLTLIRIDRETAVIQANRFTTRDGMKLGESIGKELGKKANKNQVPPDWFLDQYRELRRRVDDLEDEH